MASQGDLSPKLSWSRIIKVYKIIVLLVKNIDILFSYKGKVSS